MDATERETKLTAVTAMLQQAIRFAEKGDWESAGKHIDEAETAFLTVPDAPGGAKDPRWLGLAAAIAEGRGQLFLRFGKTAEALPFLERGIELRREEQAVGGTPPPLSVAIAYVNLTGALHRLGQPEKALEYNIKARAELSPLDLPPAKIFLAAAFEAGANLLSQLDRHEESKALFAEGLAITEGLVEQKLPGVAQLRTEILVAAARAAGKAGQHGDAIAHCARAADLSWERYEQEPQAAREAISHFVAAQMNLLAFAELAGRYAEAEDALFKVVRLIGPEPRVIERGLKFYETLKTLDDARLEAGNLPREEVEESHIQLLQIAAQARPAATA